VRSPLAVDVTNTIKMDTPPDFKTFLPEPRIEVLPLARSASGSHTPGWCTYTYEHDQAPELEVLCGGVNGKTPRAGAIWRQGHLLHFGFEPSPERLTDPGKALLVNAICYIARFTEDRPVVRTPCVFTDGIRVFGRGTFDRWLASKTHDPQYLEFVLSPPLLRQLKGKGREELGAWYPKARGYLHADAEGKLAVDAEAEAFATPPEALAFFDRALAALGEPARALLARRLLNRYAPGQLEAEASAEMWREWLRKNRPYLFFSDTGGYRWHIDPLAKRRGIPSERLRGPARATLPALQGG
jgi:hypothetical protein